jgi:hypothetical protein
MIVIMFVVMIVGFVGKRGIGRSRFLIVFDGIDRAQRDLPSRRESPFIFHA